MNWPQIFILLLLATGCQSYQASEITHSDIVSRVSTARVLESNSIAGKRTGHSTLSFQQATSLYQQQSPFYANQIAQAHIARRLAETDTPLPNPNLQAGVQYGFGPNVDHSYQFGPAYGLGIAIPISNRRQLLNQTNKAASYVQAIAALNQFYQSWFELRRQFCRMALAQKRVQLTRQLNQFFVQAERIGEQLSRAGQATGLDVAQLKLAAQRSQYQKLQARQTSDLARLQLAQILGRELPILISTESLPTPPTLLKSPAELRQTAVQLSPQCTSLRAQYLLAEKSLEYQISLQYPDLQINTGLEQEAGENRNSVGLGLSIQLPLFDRNQQAIAQARAQRDAIKEQYLAAVNNAYTLVDRAHTQLNYAQLQLNFLTQTMLPRAEKNVQLARESLKAGSSNGLQFLESIRRLYQLKLEVLTQRQTLWDSWNNLEQTIGEPLYQFKSQSTKSRPAPPASLKNTTFPPPLNLGQTPVTKK